MASWEDILTVGYTSWQSSTPTSRLAIAAGLLATAAYIYSIFYELYLSPLSSFPGPRLCAVSRIPYLFVTARGKQLPWLIRMHNKYGPVLRVSPDSLTFTHERAWHDICGATKAARDGMAKDPSLAELVGGDVVNSHQAHVTIRRCLVPALRRENVRKLEEMMQGHVDKFLDSIGQSKGPVDMRDMSSFYVCDLIGDLLVGESFNLFKEETYRNWVRSFQRFARGVTILSLLNRFPAMHKILLFAIHRWGNSEREAFMKPILDIFERRIALPEKRHDMLQIILDGDPTDKRRATTMPLELLREFIPFLFFGGCETTPTIMTGFLYLVLRKQSINIRKRLLAEIRGAFSSEADITMERVTQSHTELPYFEACLQEAFRCYSPAGTGTDRVVPPSGAKIGDWMVPGGTVVAMLHQVTYSVDHHFARSGEYIPERWLPGDECPDDCAQDKKESLKPFSVGPQGCFGQDLAFYMMRLATIRLLYRYDLELTPECENWIEGQPTFSLRVKPPLMVVAKQWEGKIWSRQAV